MNGLQRLRFVLASRGIQNTLHRSRSVLRRFDSTPDRYLANVRLFAQLAGEFNTTPSFPIVTRLLSLYGGALRELKHYNLDLLSHGHKHVDFSHADPALQALLIRESRTALEQFGVHAPGFRAPYLHWNDQTLETLSANGFEFDSSAIYSWPLSAAPASVSRYDDALSKAMKFYVPYLTGNCRPFFVREDLLEIPVSMPDDEILMDRLLITEPDIIFEIWQHVLAESHRKEAAFVVQLHPERIHLLYDVLKALLQAALLKSPRVWLASLTHIRDWWHERRQLRVCCTVEADAVSITFANRHRHTILLANANGHSGFAPWDSELRLIKGDAFRLSTTRLPLVGVGSAAAGSAGKLEELGYCYETASPGRTYSLFLEEDMTQSEIQAAITACRSPLIKNGFWPSGCKSCLCLSGDIDCLTAQDFLLRFVGLA